MPAYKLPIDFHFCRHGNTGWRNSEKKKEKCFQQPEFSNFDPRWDLPLVDITVTLRESGRNSVWHCPLFQSPTCQNHEPGQVMSWMPSGQGGCLPKEIRCGGEYDCLSFVSPESRTELEKTPRVGTWKGLDKHCDHFRPCRNTDTLYPENVSNCMSCISCCKHKTFLNYWKKKLFRRLLYIFM